MSSTTLIENLFNTIDQKNTDGFMAFLDEQCSFRFGNLPQINGCEAIQAFVSGFFDSIHALEHNILEYLPIPSGMACHGTVTYTRHDHSVLTVPFANIYKINDQQVTEYLVFMDASALYKAHS